LNNSVSTRRSYSRLGETNSGQIARSLCSYKDYKIRSPGIFVEAGAILPAAGSKEEPEWLKELRLEGIENVNFDHIHAKKFAKSEDFKYRFLDLRASLKFADDVEDAQEYNVVSKEDFLLFLEGLDWK
jgi:hypothetical protein